MKSLIGKKIFVLERHHNGYLVSFSNWEDFNGPNMKVDKVHGPFEVLDAIDCRVVIQDGLRFRLINITDIELATPLTEAIAE